VGQDDPKVVVSGAEGAEAGREALENAATDARHLMENSTIVPKLVSVDIIARQLFLLIRSGIENELVHGWDIENVNLVIQTLGMSAQEKAVAEPVTPKQVRDALLHTVLPVVDIFCQMQEQHEREEEAKTETVPGDDPGKTQ
jgi:hypothetical protein